MQNEYCATAKLAQGYISAGKSECQPTEFGGIGEIFVELVDHRDHAAELAVALVEEQGLDARDRNAARYGLRQIDVHAHRVLEVEKRKQGGAARVDADLVGVEAGVGHAVERAVDDVRRSDPRVAERDRELQRQDRRVVDEQRLVRRLRRVSENVEAVVLDAEDT